MKDKYRLKTELIQSLFDSIPDIIFFKDVHGVYFGCNMPFSRFVGMAKAEIIGKTDYDLFKSDVAQSFREQDEIIMTQLTPRHNQEWVTYPDGRRVLFDTLKTPYRGEDGTLIGILGISRDITEQKSAEDALQQAHDIVENVQLGLYVYHLEDFNDDRTLRMKYANPATECMTGIAVSALVGKTLDENFPHLRAINVPQRYAEVVRSGAAHIFEDILYGDDRVMRACFSVKAFPLPHNHVGVAFENITEKVAIQDTIKQSISQLKKAEEIGNTGSWDYNLITGELLWSDQTYRIYGETPEHFTVTFDNVVAHYPDEDRELVLAAFHSALREQSDLNIDHRIVTGSGESRFVQEIGRLILADDGQPLRMIGSVVDITERKLTEQALKRTTLLLNDAQRIAKLGAWELDLVSGKTTWTEEVYRIHEVDRDFDHNLHNGISFYHPDDQDTIAQAIQRALETKQAFDEICRFITAKGNELWVRVSGHPITRKGKVTQLVGMFQDITAQKRSELELLQAKEQAESASKAKSNFVANMSHEIRTPLNGVIGFMDLLQRTQLTPLQQQYLRNAHVSAHTLLAIINDILDFSKIEAGMLHLENITTDMFALLEESIATIKYAAQEKKLRVLLDIERKIPRFALVDPLRLKQVLTNLLSNAVKFTTQGEVELRVRYTQLDERKGRYTFMVRDTGIGITAAQQERLFRAFAQADSSTTRKFGGTGLGLTISAMLVQKMGSTIQVESEPGQYSIFYFDLITDTLNIDVAVPEVVAPEQEVLTHSHVKILVAEDVAMNMILLKAILDRMLPDSEVIEAQNGFEVVALWTEHQPDLLFMDVQMPEMDGIEATQEIRRRERGRTKHVPIIALTAGAFQEEKDRCLAAGMDDFIAKPISAERIQLVLNKYVQSETQTAFAGHFHKDRLMQRCGDLRVMKQVIAMVLTDFPAKMKKMKAAIEHADLKTLRLTAHQLKGSAATVEFPQLAALAGELEQMAEGNDNMPRLQTHYAALSAEWESVSRLLAE
ncbi:MAG: PAS domain S-box protein [Candidatus Viridilinea halotolerans]|uniref:Circadian input-output histidine kinase CikA n=1 Tax=Candidatus Viridilinea halotolerans TaxID=2491704 RepID=A0A426TVM6_9CHLR|nr:MAG: PAS domain S-box protein [Candidatus Viridilinea halotolerans]